MNFIDKLIRSVSTAGSCAIVLHDYPDPDAVASGVVLQKILNEAGVSAEVYYSGNISNLTVNKMLIHFNIRLYSMEKVGLPPGKPVIFVDHKQNIKVPDTDLAVVIDHHNGSTKLKTGKALLDIRPSVGACSSLIGSYLLDRGIKIKTDVATLLMIGLFIDTNRLTRHISGLDIDVFYRLYPTADMELLNDIILNVFTLKDLEQFSAGIQNLFVHKDIGIVSSLDPRSRHLLPVLCDFFLQAEDLNLVIGFYRRDGYFFISVRSGKNAYRADSIIKKMVQNYGSGGGHKSMAAGRMSLEKLGNDFDFLNYLKGYILTI